MSAILFFPKDIVVSVTVYQHPSLYIKLVLLKSVCAFTTACSRMKTIQCMNICLSERKLFYLDPHRVQPFVDFSSITDSMDDSFHCAYPSYMDVSHLDPSIAIVRFFLFNILQ